MSDTLRDDGGGRIVARLDGREQILFDFTLDDGASYEFDWPSPDDDTFVVTVSRNRQVNVGAGRFDNCVSFYFDVPEVLDDEHFWTFAPGVGIVRAGGFVGAYTELFSAVVDGKVITKYADEIPVGATRFQVSAYPNPFRSRTTIWFEAVENDATVALLDLTGRLIADLMVPACNAQRCTLQLDRGGLAAGMYVLAVRHGASLDAHPVIVLP